MQDTLWNTFVVKHGNKVNHGERASQAESSRLAPAVCGAQGGSVNGSQCLLS